MDQPNFSNTNNSSNPFDLTKTNIKSEFDNQSHETLSDLTENPLPITDPSTQIVPSSVAASAIIGNSPHQEIQPPLQQQQQQPPQPPPQMEKRSPNLSFYSNQNAIKFQGGLSQCLEKLSKQFNSLPNDSLRGRTMYEMYNMAGMGESSCEDEMSEEARNSVLEAILEIECCNTPLRQEIIDAMIASGDQSFNNPLKYEDYCRIESSSKLHQLEIDRMEELKNACMMLRNPYKHVVHKTNQLEDAVKVTEAAIRRLIKMSKRLSAFNRLSQNDQIALLKGSIIEMMCIRATTNFNSENNFWYFIDDNAQGLTMVSMEVLKNANWINFMSHKNFAVKFNSKFKNDPMIADMSLSYLSLVVKWSNPVNPCFQFLFMLYISFSLQLTAIILFRPSRGSTTNQEIIRDEFLNYCYLLKRYLYVNSDGDKCEAKAKYICLMHRLEELFYLAEDIVRIYLDMDPCNATPLLCELFDLK
ncbi:Ligand binding domain protein [Blomia tropicalis]|nr:Ligand binding domain protein [Blomia tropicalis]